MTSILIYRASFYLMLTVATMILCGGGSDSRVDVFLPAVMCVAGVTAFFFVDQSRGWWLPRDLANILAICTLGLLFLEYRSDELQLIRSLGHWLAYLQLIKYFRPKNDEDDWFLFLLGLTQVLIGSVINQGDLVGLWLLSWAILSVWVLGLFFLERELRRFRMESGPAIATAASERSRAARRPPGPWRTPIAASLTSPTPAPRCGPCSSLSCWGDWSSCCSRARQAPPGRVPRVRCPGT